MLWLEGYLAQFPKILFIISHSQDFMNNVCTNIVHMHQQKLITYGGNYDTYRQTRAEKEEHQMKRYNWEQDQIKHMKEYIARFGHGSAKLAKQAQSKEKTLAKMERAGLTAKVRSPPVPRGPRRVAALHPHFGRACWHCYCTAGVGTTCHISAHTPAPHCLRRLVAVGLGACGVCSIRATWLPPRGLTAAAQARKHPRTPPALHLLAPRACLSLPWRDAHSPGVACNAPVCRSTPRPR